jgi:hypothetical protein
MPTALVQGPEPRIAPIATALRAQGFEVVVAPPGDAGPSRPPGSLDGYVGMPEGPSRGPVEAVLAALATVSGLASVANLLAADATIALVIDDPDGDRGLPAAVRLLARTVVASRGRPRLVVRPEPCSAYDIASVMCRTPDGDRYSTAPVPGRGSNQAPSLADVAPALGHADWRNEVLSLAGNGEPTYLGWLNRDDEALVGVLRGSVLSPLQPMVAARAGDHADPTPSLARAVLVDLLGDEVHCPACETDSGGCGACDGTGLSESLLDLADSLTKEVLSFLPGDSFELPVSTLRAWLDQVLGGVPGHDA